MAKVALGLVALFVAAFLFSTFYTPNPARQERRVQERAYEECMKQFNDPLLDPVARATIVRGACLRLRNDMDGKPNQPSVQVTATAAANLTPAQRQRAACADGIEASQAEYDARMQRGEFKAAADGLRKCSQLLEDPYLQTLVSQAESRARPIKSKP